MLATYALPYLFSASLLPVALLPASRTAEASPFCYNTGMKCSACTGCRERDRLIADLRRRASQLEAQVERLTRFLEKAQRDGLTGEP